MGNLLMFRDDIKFGKCTMREQHLSFTARAGSWVNRESIFDHILPENMCFGKKAASHIK